MEHFYDHATIIAIYAIYAMSLNLLLGYAGQLSVAHAAFGAVGGYTAAYLAVLQGWAFIPSLVLGIAAAALIGALIALPALYLDVRYLILLTLAFSTAMTAVIGAIPELGGRVGISPVPSAELFGSEPLLRPSQFFPLALVLGLAVLAICARLAHSPFGRVLRGIRDDELATRGVGKDIVLYKVAVFGVASGLAGLAGVLFVYYTSVAQVAAFDLSESMLIIAMIVIGGTANLLGSILGAALVVMLDQALQDMLDLDPSVSALWRLAIYGGLILLFLMVRPQGILPERATPLAAWRWLRRRLGGARPSGGLEPALATAGGAFADPQTAIEPNGRGGSAGPSTAALVADAPRERERSGPAYEDSDIVLEAVGLTKHFGGIRAAEDLTIRLRRGQVTGLIGPNGAGKTTIFNLLTGVIPPDAGTVELHGQDIGDWKINRIARAGMARTYQDVRVFPRMSVLENVAMAVPGQVGEGFAAALVRPLASHRSEQRVREQAIEHLRFVGLADQAETLAGSLPFGEQKLLALARVLATDAEVLLLDEPASGIDIEWIERMLEAIERLREMGKSVCIVEHNLHVVERAADWVYFLEAGRITAEGSMQDLKGQERLAEVYFGSA
jgi:branched-chain amino acid transport system permease protein